METSSKSARAQKRLRNMTVNYPKDVTKDMIIDILQENIDKLPNEVNLNLNELKEFQPDPNKLKTSDMTLTVDCDKSFISLPENKNKILTNKLTEVKNASNQNTNQTNDYIIGKNDIFAKFSKEMQTSTFRSVLWKTGTFLLNEFLDQAVFDISRKDTVLLTHCIIIGYLFHNKIANVPHTIASSNAYSSFKNVMKETQKEGPAHIAVGTLLLAADDVISVGETSDTLLGLGCVAASLLLSKVRKNAVKQNKNQIKISQPDPHPNS